MKDQRSESELKKALLDPAGSFSCPADVLASEAFGKQDKIEILRRWEYDARELEVAEEENMGGASPSILSEILDALRTLNAEVDTENSPPTKQGGQ